MALKHLNYYASKGAAAIDIINGGPVEITNVFAVVGGIGYVGGVDVMYVWLNIDIGTSTSPQIKALMGESLTDINYPALISTISASKADNQELIDEFPDADGKYCFAVQLTGAARYVQLYVKDAVNGTGQIDGCKVTFRKFKVRR